MNLSCSVNPRAAAPVLRALPVHEAADASTAAFVSSLPCSAARAPVNNDSQLRVSCSSCIARQPAALYVHAVLTLFGLLI